MVVAAGAAAVRWRGWLTESTTLFLLSLVISVSLWAYVNVSRTERSSRTTTKVVAVVPAITGEPAFGFSLLGIRVTPQTVVLTGEPNALARLETVTTDAVNIAGAPRDFVQVAAVVAPPQVQVTPSRVRVAVQIAATIAVTTVRGIHVDAPRPPAGIILQMQPDVVQIQVQGPLAIVNRLRAADFTARVDDVEFKEGRQQVAVRVHGPRDVEVLSIAPATVTVTVKKGS